MASDSTLVIISRNRHDLLKRCLDSFIAHQSGIKPDATIIIEDSTADQPKWYKTEWPYYMAYLGKITWLSNGRCLGDGYSCYRAEQEVNTSEARCIDYRYQFEVGDEDDFLRKKVYRDEPYVPYEPTEMPKILLAIVTCHRREYGKWEKGTNGYTSPSHVSGSSSNADVIRETWARDIKDADYKFFYGAPHNREPLADEVFLDCLDDYEHLSDKTIGICKYALAHDYDLVCKIDDDVYCRPQKLVYEISKDSFDYAGYVQGDYVSGGGSYWMSRKMFTLVANFTGKRIWAEDCFVGEIAKQAGIKPVHLDSHKVSFRTWLTDIPNDCVTAHAVTSETMRELYAREHAK
jgi:hypothetical protein